MKTQILNGDCIEMMKTLPDKSVNCCVTSPPYFGLRDYGHDGQIGLEETPEAFVQKMVEVFREVKRVLRDDGTCWVNLGDSYYNYRPGKGQALAKQSCASNDQDLPQSCARRGNKLDGLKEKDLIGIPWRVAFALQADGWYLRQDIIWHKPNPMPESVQDRCTKAHEYIFLLSKQERYYYDREPIREPIKPTTNGKSGVRRSGDSRSRSKEHWGIPHNPENVIVEYEESIPICFTCCLINSIGDISCLDCISNLLFIEFTVCNTPPKVCFGTPCAILIREP
jgi:DNA modification methylase